MPSSNLSLNLIRFLVPSLVFSMAMVSGHALAKKSDRQQAMDIKATSGDWTTAESGVSELSGDVRIEQGTLKIEASRAKVEHGANAIQRVTLFGSPARLQEELDDGSGIVRAAANEIQYELAKNEVMLIGAVEVTKPRGTLTGQRVRYDLGTGKLNAEGGSGRIQMRLEPAKPAN